MSAAPLVSIPLPSVPRAPMRGILRTIPSTCVGPTVLSTVVAPVHSKISAASRSTGWLWQRLRRRLWRGVAATAARRWLWRGVGVGG